MSGTKPLFRSLKAAHIIRVFLLAAVLLAGSALPVAAADVSDCRVQWGPSCEWLRFSYLKQAYEYARDLMNTDFPAAGQSPEVKVYDEWPVVALLARWTASVDGWPAKYRANAVDIMLMLACDAQLYEYLFPDVIRYSRFTYPPEFLREANSPDGFDLAKAIRGKEVAYEITAKAGFGASDYTIKTKIRIGLTEDTKTAFFHDQPEYISDYLKTRQYFFGGHDTGDCIHFETRIFCVCADRRLFRGETMRRIEDTSRYLVQRIYKNLDDAPTEQEIEDYLNLIRNGHQNLDEFIKKYHHD